jgi:4-hydroxybenzoate polyprenyltransferase
MKNIVLLSRPRFWIYALGPFLLTFATIHTTSLISLNLVLMFVYFTFPANILIYGVNDLYDKETDSFNEKKAGYESALPKTNNKDHILKKVIFYSNIIFILYALITFTVLPILFLLIFVLLAHQYSAPPLRAKAIPFVDSIVSGILYILPVCVSWGILYNTVPPLIPILAGTLWSMSMHAYSAVPDIHADKKAHIQTGATILGKNKMLILCGILFTIASILAAPYLGIFSYGAGFVYVCLIILSINKKTPEDTLQYYKLFPIVNTLIGGIIFFYILWNTLHF